MTSMYEEHLKPLSGKLEEMLKVLVDWSETNSGSYNPEGLEKMRSKLKEAFSILGGEIKEEALDNGVSPAISIRKRAEAPIQILLAGHFDTVFSPPSDFLRTQYSKERLIGPGVADMKGGILIILYTLKILENSPFAANLGWEVFLNPDEEISSMGSKNAYYSRASVYDLGLVYEPCFSDGQLVSSRKGIINASLQAFGKAAHAGRDFHLGKNAIVGLAKILIAIDNMNQAENDLTLNIGTVQGGSTTNIVPGFASAKINMRANKQETLAEYLQKIKELTLSSSGEGLNFSLEVSSTRPPKQIDKDTEAMFSQLCSCGADLGLSLKWKPSGGGSDACFLADAGLTTLDTLGPIGGQLHTHQEYIENASLIERTQLSALFLMKIANGEIKLPKKRKS